MDDVNDEYRKIYDLDFCKLLNILDRNFADIYILKANVDDLDCYNCEFERFSKVFDVELNVIDIVDELVQLLDLDIL